MDSGQELHLYDDPIEVADNVPNKVAYFEGATINNKKIISLIDNHWEKAVIWLTRFSFVLMDTIKTGSGCR
jgi:hypothetical protein